MTDILNIKDEPIFDDRIVNIETHTYRSLTQRLGKVGDEVRIPIQQQVRTVVRKLPIRREKTEKEESSPG